MSTFSPAYEGEIELDALPDDFTERIARRVESGLLVPGIRRRANYVVRSRSREAIAFGGEGFWTDYNVGFNEVEVRRSGPSRLAYRGSFRRWATYAVIHGLALSGFVLVGLLIWPGVRSQLSDVSWGWIFVLALLAFFGLAWPWILVAIHRRVVPRVLERILRESLRP